MSQPNAVSMTGAPVSCVAFDLDGTIYFGDTLADGAAELLDFLRHSGVEVYFFTNNSVKTRADVIDKLVRMGLPSTIENTYTSGSAVGGYLHQHGIDRVALVGSAGLAAELLSSGVTVTENGCGAQALVIGMVSDFDFSHRPLILESVSEDVPLISANMDMTYPVEGGQLRPGCGAIVRAVEGWTGRSVDQFVGKPGTFMLDLLCVEHGWCRTDVLVVGDTLESDIAMARAAGCRSVLVDPSGTADVASDTVVVRGLHELQTLLSGICARREGLRT